MELRTGESPLEEPTSCGKPLFVAIVYFIVEGEAIDPYKPSEIRAVGKPMPQGPPANSPVGSIDRARLRVSASRLSAAKPRLGRAKLNTY